jgi:hypothetical protein
LEAAQFIWKGRYINNFKNIDIMLLVEMVMSPNDSIYISIMKGMETHIEIQNMDYSEYKKWLCMGWGICI